jgi:hypothetical protein
MAEFLSVPSHASGDILFSPELVGPDDSSDRSRLNDAKNDQKPLQIVKRWLDQDASKKKKLDPAL